MARPRRVRGSFRSRHWSRDHEPDKSFRSVLHDEAWRIRNRSRVEPADCGSAWRFVDVGESCWAGMRGLTSVTEVAADVVGGNPKSQGNLKSQNPKDSQDAFFWKFGF